MPGTIAPGSPYLNSWKYLIRLCAKTGDTLLLPGGFELAN
jgi:hypothetical protein